MSPSESRSDPSAFVGALGLGMALLGFSMTGVWVRWLLALDPFAVVGWRVVVALAILVPLTIAGAGERARAPSLLRNWRVHAVALRMTVFFVVAVIGFQQAPVAVVLLGVGLSPAWVVILSRLEGSAVSPSQATGVVIALFGAILGLMPIAWAWLSGGADAEAAAVGVFGGVSAGMLAASYAVARRTLQPDGRPPSDAFLAGLTSAWALLSFALAFAYRGGAMAPSGPAEWASVLGFGVVSTAGPLWGFAAASRSLPPLFVALSTPIIPFTGALLAWLLLDQVPPSSFFLGAPVVLAGIAWVLLSNRTM